MSLASQIPDTLRETHGETENKKVIGMKAHRESLIIGITMAAVTLMIGLAVILVDGCSTTVSNENMLSAAGFKEVPANTPERQAHLTSLPAYQITPVQRDGTVYYTYPDPGHNALYVGQEAQYQEYQRLRLQKQMADEQVAAAQMNEDNAWNVWGPWGAPGWAWR